VTWTLNLLAGARVASAAVPDIRRGESGGWGADHVAARDAPPQPPGDTGGRREIHTVTGHLSTHTPQPLITYITSLTHRHMHTSTQAHTFTSLSRALTRSLSIFLSLPLSSLRSLPPSLSPLRSLFSLRSHSLSLSISLSSLRSLSRTHAPSHTHTPSHTITLTPSLHKH
jgi:hypothetical protein